MTMPEPEPEPVPVPESIVEEPIEESVEEPIEQIDQADPVEEPVREWNISETVPRDDYENWNLELEKIKTLSQINEKISFLSKQLRNGNDGDSLNRQNALRDLYQLKCEKYSSKSDFWIEWINFEMSLKNYDETEKIFQKCLPSVPCVPLYTVYIDYIQHIHSPALATSEEDSQKARATIIAAFDFVLNGVGSDFNSGDLWIAYLHFVKAGDAPSSYEEQQKMDLMRKIFHKSIHTPLYNIEEIWKEYDAFENNLSKLTAKKFIADQAGGYMTARGAIKDLKTLVDPIEHAAKNWIAQPPSWSGTQIQMLNYWKRYISWERANPLAFEESSQLVNRVSYTYQSALLHLCCFPEIWYDYATFLQSNGAHADTIIKVLRTAISANPSSLLLTFTLAEFLETQKKVAFEEIQGLFEALLSTLDQAHTACLAKYEALGTHLAAYLASSAPIQDIEGEDEGERRERDRAAARDTQLELEVRVNTPRARETSHLKRVVSLVWIVYMRLTRRSQSIRSARLVFSRARKCEIITSHVFVASALMEYYVNKDAGVAGKIFEIGLKTFPLGAEGEADGGVGYIMRYIEFLICLNDDNNTRALFERALSSLPVANSRPLWEKYIEYETQYGDLTNLHALEKRFAALFPPRPVNSLESVEKIGAKWAYFDIDYITNVELGLPHLLKAGDRLAAPAVASSAPVGQLGKLRQGGGGGGGEHDKSRMAPMLSGINVERYARPDLSRWNLYKPEPATARVCQVVEVGGNGAAGSATSAALPPSTFSKNAHTSGELPVSSTILVPEQIADFMARLPRKESYTGPILNAPEILALIFAMPIPPLKTPRYVPAPSGFDTGNGNGKKRGSRWEDGDRSGRSAKRPFN